MIRNLIIDFGGVLYRIAPEKTLERFNAYGSVKHSYKDLADMKVFKDYETGDLSNEQFISSIRSVFAIPESISDNMISDAWNETLVSVMPHSIDTLLKLKKKYSLTLLSNTNQLHYEHFYPHCQELFSIFDKCFFSHKINMRKPNTEIYKHVISIMGYKSKNTMFIDDSQPNLNGAKEAGLHTFLISPDTSLSDFPDSV